MPIENLYAFKNKRVLLLQGPVGPFFTRFADDIGRLNATILKVNFNGGDEFFYPNAIRFTQALSNWGSFLEQLIQQNHIETIVMFGDCREIHMQAKAVAQRHQIEIYVFEEGYMRPNHITLESMGVNGYSPLSKDIRDYVRAHSAQDVEPPPVIEVGKTYWYAAWWAIVYYLAASLHRGRFPHYQHHRPLTIREAWPWIRGTWRKWLFKFKERGIEQKLADSLQQQYYLVPLQLHNDFQISHHSNYRSIEQFIEQVMRSFAEYAPPNTYLTLKQHPFDRGYKDYTTLIQQLGRSLGISSRVFFIHDQYLPTLINNAIGVIVINSTVGLSAIESFRPVKVCGEAIYNMEHLTIQESLDDFWHTAQSFTPDPIHVHQYLDYLSQHTQHNGSFYRRIKHCRHSSGVLWTE